MIKRTTTENKIEKNIVVYTWKENYIHTFTL